MSGLETRQRERIDVSVFTDAEAATVEVASSIAELIRERTAAGRHTVLGLATGSSPVRLYRELIRLHRETDLSFARVITFNLDEYYGLSGDHPESYRRFMQEQLFDHIDIPTGQTHVPDGTTPREQVFAACRSFEDRILEAGGIDIQILGIGRTGHIGFNEPGSGPETRTRLVTLDALTRRDAARDFRGEANVPRQAITLGVGTILEARQIFLLAWGEAKADIIARTVEAPAQDALPASFLQQHPACRICIDEAAAGRLTRFDRPWLVGPVDWTPATIRKAVLWLARTTGKSLLKLVEADYAENGMADLLAREGGVYGLNIELFNVTQHTITGWPGGKPAADDTKRPERATPHPKRVLVLSPEPMDAFATLGGTLNRLAVQGHALTIACLTSGNLAVPDADARGVCELMRDLAERNPDSADPAFAQSVDTQLDAKGAFGLDSPDIRLIKGLIRRGEARASVRTLGLEPDCLRFLDLPFYETGRYRRFEPGEEDRAALERLLAAEQPHQVFATGLDQDPQSVAGIGFGLLRQTLTRLAEAGWLADCRFWLYRGPGGEWDPHLIDMAVPLSPDELDTKIQGIYQHQTQRSQTPGPVDGSGRTIWDQARSVNEATAETYDALGLADYAAIEGFRRWLPTGAPTE